MPPRKKQPAQKHSAPEPAKPPAATLTATRANGWLSTAGIALAIIGCVLAVYWQTGGFEFVNLDDGLHVYENPRVATGLTAENLRWAFAMIGPSQWHPLTWVSHQIDCELYGLDSRGHHLTNVALHAASAVLLFLLLRSLTGRTWPAALAAALFGLHPVNVESVAWVAERKNVLSLFFAMLMLVAYASYARRGGRARYALVAVLLAAGMMAKPMLVTAPFLLLLLDFWPLRRCESLPLAEGNRGSGPVRSLKFLILEKAPLQFLAAGLALMTVLRHRMTAAAFLAENPTVRVPEAVPALGRLADAFISYVTYLRMTFWPANLAIVLPDRPDDYYQTLWLAAAGCIGLLAAITVFAVFSWRRYSYFAVGWLWFLGALAPVVGILPVGTQSIAERYAYLPLIGLLIAAAWFLGEIAGRGRSMRTVATGIAVICLFALGYTAHAQTAHWRNSVTLFSHAIAVTGGEHMAHYNLGSALQQRGRFEQAAEQYRLALEFDEGDARAHHNLALVLGKLDRIDESLLHYHKSLQYNPELALAHSNLGVVYTELGRHAEAEFHLQKAVRLERNDYMARVHLAILCRNLGRFDEAIEHLRDSLEIQPHNAQAHTNMGIVYHDLGRFDRAIRHFEQAVDIDADHAPAYSNLGVTLHAAGRSSDALAVLQQAVRLDASNAKLHVRLGTLHGQTGDVRQAALHLGRAAELTPDDAAVQFNLAMALAQLGRFAQAEVHGRKATELRPDGAAAYNLLGSVLASRGKESEALAQFGKALELRPNWPEAGRNLARLLISSSDPSIRNTAEAVRIARAASEQSGDRDPATLEILAAGYAADGRLEEAQATIELAYWLSREAGNVQHAAHLQQTAEQYRQREAQQP